MKNLLQSCRFIVIICISWFFLHVLFITIDGFTNTKSKADVAVVLGNKVNDDGTLSPRLKARLDKSIELYQNKQVKKILVSGGFGKEGFWEAEKMKNYLVENKIPQENIITDNFGDNTEKTVDNTLKISKKENFKSIVSVSQFYHQSRIKKLFYQKGVKSIETSSPNYFELRDFYSLFREFFAFYF